MKSNRAREARSQRAIQKASLEGTMMQDTTKKYTLKVAYRESTVKAVGNHSQKSEQSQAIMGNHIDEA